MFCPLLFLVLSGVSLETAASFLLFLDVAMRLGEKFYRRLRQILSFILRMKVIISSDYEGKESPKTKMHQLVIFEGTMSNSYDLYNPNNTFISPIYTFPWRET